MILLHESPQADFADEFLTSEPPYMAVSNGLFILHDLHLKLKSVQEELERGPRTVKARENLLAKRQAELDAIKALHTERRKLADNKNLQLKTNEAKLADL